MKKALGLLLLVVISIGCYAGDKVRGELRTEDNGFQWYCYNGEEAYTKEGVRLFPNIKTSNIKYVLLTKGVEKDSNLGCFLVELPKEETIYIDGDIAKTIKKKLHNLYSTNGELIKEKIIHVGARVGLGQYGAKSYYSLIETPPFTSIGNNQLRTNVSLINDAGVSIKQDINYRNGISGLLTYEGSPVIIGLWCETNTGKTFLITDNEKTLELQGSWKFSLEDSFIYAQNEGTKSQKMFTLDCTYIGELEKSEGTFCLLRKDELLGVMNKKGDWIIPLSSKYSEIQYVGERFFMVRSNGYSGILSLDGTEIIPTSRGYTSIGDYDANKGTFAFTASGYSGQCNAQGKEISTTKNSLAQNTSSTTGTKATTPSTTTSTSSSKSSSSSSSSDISSGSTPNDCYWYNRCLYEEYDSQDQIIKESQKFMYPQNKDCDFEIQFEYASNYPNATYPITIYLNEINRDEKRLSSQIIGKVVRGIKSSVKYREDRVDVFVHGYQITVTSEGRVIMFKGEGGKYINGRLFLPEADFIGTIYGIRYEVLVEKLKKINWGK